MVQGKRVCDSAQATSGKRIAYWSNSVWTTCPDESESGKTVCGETIPPHKDTPRSVKYQDDAASEGPHGVNGTTLNKTRCGGGCCAFRETNMDPDLQARIDSVARYLLKIGVSVIPIADSPDTPEQQRKRPLIKWGAYCDAAMSPDDWRFPGANVGLVTGLVSGVVVVDCDSEDATVQWMISRTATPLRIKTRRGMHFYYRHPGGYVKSGSGFNVDGCEYDVKGDRSYVLAPPSMRGGHQYQVVPCSGNIRGRWIVAADLPDFDVAWRPETVRDSAWDDSDQIIRDGVAYIRQIFAKEGEGGDRDTFRAACKLVESGMTEASALAALMEWNVTNADPPWQPRDLLRKVQCAMSEVNR